jgi:hypothetical protein
MDLVSDPLCDRRNLRALRLIDTYSRECSALSVSQGIPGEAVVEVFAKVARARGAPVRIQVDNGPALVSKRLDREAYGENVVLMFSRPGKPADNAHGICPPCLALAGCGGHNEVGRLLIQAVLKSGRDQNRPNSASALTHYGGNVTLTCQCPTI